MRRRRVPGETSAADAVVVDVVDAVDSDASERALEGGSLIYALHAPRARAALLRLILV